MNTSCGASKGKLQTRAGLAFVGPHRCSRSCIYTSTYIHVHVAVGIYIIIRTCTYTCMSWVYTSTNVHVHVYTCIYIYIYIYIYNYIYNYYIYIYRSWYTPQRTCTRIYLYTCRSWVYTSMNVHVHAVLLCLVCLFDLACFFFSSFSSLI